MAAQMVDKLVDRTVHMSAELMVCQMELQSVVKMV